MTPGQLSHSRKITLVPSHGSTFVYMIPPQNDMPPRVTPVVVPGQEIHSSTKSRNVSCKINAKQTPVLEWNRSPGKLEREMHA